MKEISPFAHQKLLRSSSTNELGKMNVKIFSNTLEEIFNVWLI